MTEPAPDQAAPAGGPTLTREHTAALLQERGTPPAAFHLYGAHVDDAIVLDHRVGGWVVFYSERGGESTLLRHATEDAACRDLLDRLSMTARPIAEHPADEPPDEPAKDADPHRSPGSSSSVMTEGGGRATRTASLIAAATVLSLGHHLDHVVRGNHTGWPVTAETTPFTYSLAIYPLVLLGVVLSRITRAAAGYWLALSGSGTVFLLAVHVGPGALEPPGDITGAYGSTQVGWVAFGWLLCLIAVLFVTFVHEACRWRARSQTSRTEDAPRPET